MRKKFVKSSRPTYKKRIRKSQQGMKFVSYNPVSNPKIDYKDITNPSNPFSEYNFNTTYDKPEALVVPVKDEAPVEEVINKPESPIVTPAVNKPVASKVTYTPKSYKGLAAFNKAYDEVEASNPEAKKYRQFLTKMAEQESGFNSAIQNRAGAPTYGYFQFMQDDKKYNNIRQYAGTDIETFRNNPKLQIEAAIKLAKSFEKGFSKEDLELANKNGYSTWGLLGGAWLAGNGGVRKFLRGQGNPSDRHWSKEGKGTDVAIRIKAFNFKEGGIIKYQEPAHGIARRDAIKDYRPELPLSPIKQPVESYMPTQQPVLSPDNRTGWEKEVSRQIKADRTKNDNLYGNQHTWNWSAPFTNTRITKDNASAMFDFDKSAAMSTFAIGTGIASPVTTATSIATSLVGAGIGNKIAGDKGALVGGFVGGMVNPRFGMRFNKKNSSSNIKQPIVVAKESKLTPEEIAGMPKGERNQPIKSKLDWKNWSKGGPISKEHLAEYAQIERDARRRRYWLMTSDGQPWNGDPRTWVQLMSKDGSRFKKGKFPSNDDLYYSGINGDDIIYDDYNGRLWASSNPATARSYTNSDDRVMTIGVPNDSKTFEVDAQSKHWQDLLNPYTGRKSTTDEIVNDIFDKGNDVALIKNVRDNGPHLFKGSKYGDYFSGNEGTDVIINRKAPRKSLVGNNGDFNINNPNLYKVLAPFLLIGGMNYDKWIY